MNNDWDIDCMPDANRSFDPARGLVSNDGPLIRSALSKLIQDPRLAELELKLSSPNLFYVLRLHQTEIRHSNFLSWLLDPKGNHNLADLFLRFLLKDVISQTENEMIDEFTIDSMDLSNAIVRREWKHIDILIETSDLVICIENKFWSDEHSSQLKRYREVVHAEFPDHKRIFVFLTPYGIMPKDREDRPVFQPYSYASICHIIETVRVLYKEAIPDRVRSYIDEYCEVLRREVMKDDETNSIARSIYQNHKDALDFIFENRPDRLADVSPMFERQVRDSGWVLESCSKGFVRFLTPGLKSHLPRSGQLGWKGRESFLFELDFWPKIINLKTVISPGDERVRKLLAETLSYIDGAIKPKGAQWVVHFNEKWKFDTTSSEHSMDIVLKKIREIWPRVAGLVEKVEKQLLKIDFE